MRYIFSLVLELAALFVIAIFTPFDPDEQRPGTRLSGALVNEPVDDWSFMKPGQKVWVQSNTWYLIPHSVTTISMVVDNELYIPCGWCDGKVWPTHVARDPNVVVKIGDKLYPRKAVVVEDKTIVEQMFAGRDIDVSGVVLYRMVPRDT